MFLKISTINTQQVGYIREVMSQQLSKAPKKTTLNGSELIPALDGDQLVAITGKGLTKSITESISSNTEFVDGITNSVSNGIVIDVDAITANVMGQVEDATTSIIDESKYWANISENFATLANAAAASASSLVDLAEDAVDRAANNANQAGYYSNLSFQYSSSAQEHSSSASNSAALALSYRDSSQGYANAALVSAQQANIYSNSSFNYSEAARLDRISAQTAAANSQQYSSAAANTLTQVISYANTSEQAAMAAQASAITANTRASDASLAANVAIQAANNANGSMAAAQQASILSANSANAANGYAAAALQSANQAQSWSNDSFQYASAASNSALTARLVSADLLPADFSRDSTYWSNSSIKNNQTIPLQGSFPIVTGIGKVYQESLPIATGIRNIYSVGKIVATPNRKYRITSRYRYIAGDGTYTGTLSFDGYNTDFSSIVYTKIVDVTSITTSTGWVDHSVEVDSNLILGASGYYVRPRLTLRSNSGTVTPTFQVQFIRLEDITESSIASDRATAAITASNTAIVAANQAGVYAAAAQNSAIIANTKANDANTYANSAFNHAANAQSFSNSSYQYSQVALGASGNAQAYSSQAAANAAFAANMASQANTSASSANSFMGITAGYRDQAQGFANSAANSATAAQSNAVVAQQWAANAAANAASANTSSVLAAGYRDQAQGYSNSAANSAALAQANAIVANNAAAAANSSAASANASSVLSANYATQARTISNQIFRSDFNQGDSYWVAGFGQNDAGLLVSPSPSTAGTATLVDVPGIGKVIQATSYITMSERSSRPFIDDQQIEVSIRIRTVSDKQNGPLPNYIWITSQNANGDHSGYYTVNYWNDLKVVDGWVTRKLVFSPTNIRSIAGSAMAGAVKWRMMIGINGYTALPANGEVQQIAYIEVNDVTAKMAANTSASIAQTAAAAANSSAAAANTSSNLAASYSSSASASANNANTYANGALTSVLNTLPSSMENMDYWTYAAGYKESVRIAAVPTSTVSQIETGGRKVLRCIDISAYIGHRKMLPVIPGHIYKQSARIFQANASGNPTTYLRIGAHTSREEDNSAAIYSAYENSTVAQGWHELTGYITYDEIKAIHAGTNFISSDILVNDNATSGASMWIEWFKFEDVTAEFESSSWYTGALNKNIDFKYQKYGWKIAGSHPYNCTINTTASGSNFLDSPVGSWLQITTDRIPASPEDEISLDYDFEITGESCAVYLGLIINDARTWYPVAFSGATFPVGRHKGVLRFTPGSATALFPETTNIHATMHLNYPVSGAGSQKPSASGKAYRLAIYRTNERKDAETQAKIANTAAASANASAATAAVSSDLSASYATKSANTYQNTIRLNRNADFDLGLDGWTLNGDGATQTTWPSYLNLVPTAFGGTNMIQVEPNYGVNLYSERLYTYDPAKVYKMRARVGTWLSGGVAPDPIVYIGIRAYDANKVPINSNGGHTYPLGSYTIPNGHINRYEGYLTGESTTITNATIGLPPLGTRYFRLFIILNYQGVSAQRTYLDYFDIEEVAQEAAARNFAQIANTAAASANASAAAAQTASTLSASYRDQSQGYSSNSQYWAGQSQAQANIASNAAVSANASAASAAESKNLAARISSGLVQRNSTFTEWSNPAAYPDGWANWNNAPSISNKFPGKVSENGWELVSNASGNDISGVYGQTGPASAGYHVIEMTAELRDGTWNGGGILISGRNSAGTEVWYQYVPFTSFKDSAGFPHSSTYPSSPFRVFRGQYLIDIRTPNIASLGLVIVMNYADVFGANAYKNIAFYQVGTRPATEAEVAAGVAIPTMQANITTLQSVQATQNSAIATLQSNVSTINSSVSSIQTAQQNQNTAIASLQSTVSSQNSSITTLNSVTNNLQGNVNSIMAKAGVTINANGHVTGWQMNNNGSSGNFTITSDTFSIVKPSGGARFEYSNGAIRIYDANNVLRVRLGVW